MIGDLFDTAVRFARASATDQIARFAPALYVRLTGQTGRGDADFESPQSIARYFNECFDDYFPVLGVPPQEIGAWLAGKTLMEYGPGDLPGVALLMVAHGAERVHCVDRFPLVARTAKNVAALETMIAALPAPAQARARDCFADPARLDSPFRPGRIDYVVRPNGLSGLRAEVDFVFSRAVLEHVNDLDATFVDFATALRPGGIALHQVDLRSHGLHRRNPLDFLSWPDWMWNLMFGHKGSPNRWRVDRYREAAARAGLRIGHLERTHRAEEADVVAVRSSLAAPFRALSDEDLSWLGFWIRCERDDGRAAGGSAR